MKKLLIFICSFFTKQNSKLEYHDCEYAYRKGLEDAWNEEWVLNPYKKNSPEYNAYNEGYETGSYDV